MSFVAVDLGASNTRFTNNVGRFSIIPNNVAFVNTTTPEGNVIPDMNPVDMDVSSPDITDVLEMIIKSDNEESKFFPAHVMVGVMAENSKYNNTFPNINASKHSQPTNYISCIAAVTVSKIQSALPDELDLWVALPPVEVASSKDKVKKMLTGTYEVYLPKYNNGTTINFTIQDVKCEEESNMAILSYFFDLNRKPIPEHKDYISGMVMSLDIGASTTDIAVSKSGRLRTKASYTMKIGGNNVRELVISGVLSEYGFDMAYGDADIAIAEGRIKMGSKYVEITDIMNKAKATVAHNIVTRMNNYFSTVGIPLQSIDAIIVSGGGSMESKYIDKDGKPQVTSFPMSVHVTNALKEVCDGIIVEQHSDNPRMANICGLYIKASKG